MGIHLKNLTYNSARFTVSAKNMVYLDFAPCFPPSPSTVAVLLMSGV